jgi:hypothetical protein
LSANLILSLVVLVQLLVHRVWGQAYPRDLDKETVHQTSSKDVAFLAVLMVRLAGRIRELLVAPTLLLILVHLVLLEIIKAKEDSKVLVQGLVA